MALSPMMTQYLTIKDNNPGCLLFFRLGDFYELFFDDAITASKELDLVLTGRDCGLNERAPMCGVPFHAVDGYIAKLVEKGYKVAICEQLDNPKKGIAKREIVRVITPGTVMESDMLAADSNNYLFSVCLANDKAGVCWADISTGEFNRATIDASIAIRLNDLLLRIKPAEIICNGEMKMMSRNLSAVKYGGVCEFQQLDEGEFDIAKAEEIIPAMCKDHANILEEDEVCVRACGALLRYVRQTQKRDLKYIHADEREENRMTIDSIALSTLEIISSTNGRKQDSLFGAVNRTLTGMGARLLVKRLTAPSTDVEIINRRLDGTEELFRNKILRGEIAETLSGISDIERIGTRIAYGNITPKECVALANSLDKLPVLKSELASCKSEILTALGNTLDTLSDIAGELHAAIKNDPATFVRDGGVINDGYNKELDEYRTASKNSKSILAKIEAGEKERTGIKNLRIGFNSVFGYFIEVPKSQISHVPYEYVRKQTTANTERYITEELKQIEDKILHAEERALAIEGELYSELIRKLAAHCNRMLASACAVANIDVLCSNAEIAAKYKYTKPLVTNDNRIINITEGRHVTVERTESGAFVPNDTYMDDGDSRTMIITGPNMAGKSVYMRQTALIVILAQAGMFVPAEKAEIGVIDRIFTRVGASDDLHTGRSTFMVEMSEVAHILENATDNSLILLDEVGRGTATYDGLSIAWSIIEYLSENFKAKTLFSTHYHELTDLEGVVDGVKNYKMTVRELNGNIIFMRKLMRGSANRSFGIEVAGLSGLPEKVIDRAKRHLKKLEKLNVARQNDSAYQQISLFNADKTNEIIKILKELDLDNVSPRNAYDILGDLKEKAEEK